jgi:hypothetical protein
VYYYQFVCFYQLIALVVKKNTVKDLQKRLDELSVENEREFTEDKLIDSYQESVVRHHKDLI